jgi:imidazolonepropionase-like amidohydrolase
MARTSALALLVLGASAAAQGPPIVLTGGTVLPMTGKDALPKAVVVVRGDRIEAVRAAEGFTPPEGARVVDVAGCFVLPGLVDAHVHLDPRVPLDLFLAHGVTTVRDLGAEEAWVLKLRLDLAEGRREGPRLLAAGPELDGDPPLHPGRARVVRSDDEARAAVADLVKKGADLLSVSSLLHPGPYHALLEAAQARRLKVAGRLPRRIDAREAAALGQDSLDHLPGLLEGVRAKGGAPPDDAAVGGVARFLAEKRTFVVPALAGLRRELLPRDPATVKDPDLSWLPGALRSAGTGTDDAAGWSEALKLVGRLHAAGVRLAAGTAAPAPRLVPGASLHEELGHLVAAGLTPEEALRAATRSAAELVGLADRIGAVEPGRAADLLVVERDPRSAIGATREIRAVVARGRLITRQDRAALLQEAARAAAAPPEAGGPPPLSMEGEPIGEAVLTLRRGERALGTEQCAFARLPDGGLLARALRREEKDVETTVEVRLGADGALAAVRLSRGGVAHGLPRGEPYRGTLGVTGLGAMPDAALLMGLQLPPGASTPAAVLAVEPATLACERTRVVVAREEDGELRSVGGPRRARRYRIARMDLPGVPATLIWTDERGLPLRIEVRGTSPPLVLEAHTLRPAR